MTQTRQAAERRGRIAEGLAALYLNLKGWKILARRTRTQAGEIDLIARRNGVLAFVEVKARTHLDAGKYAVTPHQQTRMVRAASLWRSHSNPRSDLQPRFDVVVIRPWRWPHHIENAFGAEGHTQSLV